MRALGMFWLGLVLLTGAASYHIDQVQHAITCGCKSGLIVASTSITKVTHPSVWKVILAGYHVPHSLQHPSILQL